MVRKVDPAQRFSPDVVDAAPAARKPYPIYLEFIGKSARSEHAPGPPGRPGKDQRCDGTAQSWRLKRPCRAPDISRENCAWLM